MANNVQLDSVAAPLDKDPGVEDVKAVIQTPLDDPPLLPLDSKFESQEKTLAGSVSSEVSQMGDTGISQMAGGQPGPQMRPSLEDHSSIIPAIPYTQDDSPLFALSGELRNIIYRLVLVEPDPGRDHIEVDFFGYQRSNLLRTCKQIRSEALKLYYYENTFCPVVNDYNSDIRVKWTETLKQTGIQPRRLRMWICLGSLDPNWPNLLLWMRRYHAERIKPRMNVPESLTKRRVFSMDSHVIGGMWVVVKSLKKMSWYTVLEILMGMRASLVANDKRWAKD